VAENAAGLAARFGAADEARLAGWLHDLGKYSEKFTARLEGRERGLDHWSAGAWAALTQYRSAAAALAIQGHHIGLQIPDSLRSLADSERFERNHPLGLRLTEKDFPALLARLAADGVDVAGAKTFLFSPGGLKASSMLDVRMLFSALVDADFIETEAHFQRGSDGRKAYRESGPPLRAREALDVLLEHLANLARESRATAEVTSLRTDLLRACQQAGELASSVFTLSAPTGTGKTLALPSARPSRTIFHGSSWRSPT
jgi:CRISPR-associated endonuclease Cas3-HD